MNDKKANSTIELCNRRQLNFLRLERIIDKIRGPLQDFVYNSEENYVTRNQRPLSTVELIQKFDLVTMLEEENIKVAKIDQEKLEHKLLSLEEKQKLYSEILGCQPSEEIESEDTEQIEEVCRPSREIPDSVRFFPVDYDCKPMNQQQVNSGDKRESEDSEELPLKNRNQLALPQLSNSLSCVDNSTVISEQQKIIY